MAATHTTTTAPASTSDMLVSAINFHGQQLNQMLETRCPHLLTSLNKHSIDYHAYQLRSSQLTSQWRLKRLKLLDFIAQHAETLFRPVDADSIANCPEFEGNDLVRPMLPCLGSAMRVSKGPFREQVSSLLRVGDVCLCEVVGVRPNGSAMLSIMAVITLDFVTVLPRTNMIRAALVSSEKIDSHPMSAHSRVLGVILEVHGHSNRILSINPSNLPPGMTDKIKLGRVTNSMQSLVKKIFEVKINVPYETSLTQSRALLNPAYISSLYDTLKLKSADYSLLRHIKIGIDPQMTADAIRSRQAARVALRLVRKGVDLLKRGELSEAFQCLNQALNIDPNNVDGLVARGALFANGGTYDKAVADFEAALSSNPNHSNARKYLGETLIAQAKILEDEKELDRALETYNLSLTFVPGNSEATRAIALLTALKSGTVASADLNKMRALHDSDKKNDFKQRMLSILDSPETEVVHDKNRSLVDTVPNSVNAPAVSATAGTVPTGSVPAPEVVRQPVTYPSMPVPPTAYPPVPYGMPGYNPYMCPPPVMNMYPPPMVPPRPFFPFPYGQASMPPPMPAQGSYERKVDTFLKSLDDDRSAPHSSHGSEGRRTEERRRKRRNSQSDESDKEAYSTSGHSKTRQKKVYEREAHGDGRHERRKDDDRKHHASHRDAVESSRGNNDSKSEKHVRHKESGRVDVSPQRSSKSAHKKSNKPTKPEKDMPSSGMDATDDFLYGDSEDVLKSISDMRDRSDSNSSKKKHRDDLKASDIVPDEYMREIDKLRQQVRKLKKKRDQGKNKMTKKERDANSGDDTSSESDIAAPSDPNTSTGNIQKMQTTPAGCAGVGVDDKLSLSHESQSVKTSNNNKMSKMMSVFEDYNNIVETTESKKKAESVLKSDMKIKLGYTQSNAGKPDKQGAHVDPNNVKLSPEKKPAQRSRESTSIAGPSSSSTRSRWQSRSRSRSPSHGYFRSDHTVRHTRGSYHHGNSYERPYYNHRAGNNGRSRRSPASRSPSPRYRRSRSRSRPRRSRSPPSFRGMYRYEPRPIASTSRSGSNGGREVSRGASLKNTEDMIAQRMAEKKREMIERNRQFLKTRSFD